MRPLYQLIASRLAASANCKRDTSTGINPHLLPWILDHQRAASYLTRLHMPSGSGFDCGTTLDVDTSSADRLVLHVSYHHMTDGAYSGWTHHTVTVRASLTHGIELRISGRDRNGIKDYIHDCFDLALRADVDDDYQPQAIRDALARIGSQPGQVAQS